MSLLGKIVGFDPDKVNESMQKVENAYKDLKHAMKYDMQKNFVDEMGKYWACNQAQKYFRDILKPDVDEINDNSQKTFESVLDSMNSAAQSWARATDTSVPIRMSNLGTRMGERVGIDTSVIRENFNGVRGVDEANALNTIPQLEIIKANADRALASAQTAVNDCGFVGRNQADKLIESLGVIRNNISGAIDTLITSAKAAINDTVEAYGRLAEDVDKSFSIEDFVIHRF